MHSAGLEFWMKLSMREMVSFERGFAGDVSMAFVLHGVGSVDCCCCCC